MRPLPYDLRDLAAKQSGVLRSSQLSTYGFTSREVDVRVNAGDWLRLSNRIVAIQPPTRLSRLWGAGLHHHRVGLTGAAALELVGLPPSRDESILLLGPRGTRLPPWEGCQILTTDRPEFVPDDGPTRTSIPLSVAFAMGTATSLRQAVFRCTWVVQRRLTTMREIEIAIQSAPQSPSLLTAKRRLRVIDPGVHSTNEFDFAVECRRRGLPQPRRQVARTDSEGRLRYTDVEFQGTRGDLVVEIDGLGHLDAQVWLDDQWRANDLTLQGARLLRIPGLALRLDADRYFAQIKQALEAIR